MNPETWNASAANGARAWRRAAVRRDSARLVVAGLRAGYPDWSFDELASLAQDVCLQYGFDDETYDLALRILKEELD